MVKKLLTIWLSAALQILVMIGVLGYSSEDFSIGCFKEELNNRHFNVSAGNYIYEPNSNRNTPDECVAACSALSDDYKLAGLTADDICLCSTVLASSLQKANNNTSCLYKSNNGLFLKVFTIPSLANISVPESVMIFQEFLVNISTMPDPRCSHVLSFSDGRRVTITTNDTFVTHIYKSAGMFTITLSSQSVCLPEVIMANIEVITVLGNVSLECPSVLEVTESNSHCKLRVLQGSNVTASLNSAFLVEISDPVVQSLGINPGDFYTGVRSSSPLHPAGTYLLPLDTAVDDGVLIAFEVYLSRTGNFKVQIFSPKCPANSLPCFSECVSPDVPCGGPSISSCSASQEMCLTLGQCNVTSRCERARSFYSPPQSNISFINYTVRFEFTTNITTTEYSFHRLSSPVPLQRGDVIGWYSSPSSADLEFQNSSSPFLLFYPNQEFSVGQLVSKSLNITKLNRAYHFRPYIQTTSVLLIAVTPVVPRVHVNVNVSSGIRHEVLSRTVRVQERISGLHLVSPNISKTKYFPTKKDIFFAIKVTNGSEVKFRFDAGDGSDPKNGTTGKFSHFYQQRGEYTFNVTAVNEINNVTIEETLTLLEDIRNLTFMRDPWDTPGEAGIPYEVRFKFDACDHVMIAVYFGGNETLFIMCGNSTNEREFSVNYSYPAVGIYNITVHAYSKYLDTNLNITSSVEIMERISNLTLFQIKGNQDIPLKELQNSPYSLNIRVRVASGSSVTFQANASGSINGGNLQNVSVHEAEFKFEFTISRIELITVSARNRISQVNETIRVIVVGQCQSWIDFYDQRKENDPLRTTRDTPLRFSVEERQTGQDSGCNSSSCWEYSWKLFMKGGDGRYKLKDHLNNTSKDTFFIPKSTLESGLYRLRVNASCNDPRHFNRLNVSETYFMIERTQPVVLILGGLRRDVAYDAKWTLSLDASTSYDPDEKHFSSKGLMFEWTCLSNRSLVFKRNSSVARVSMEQLLEGRNYTFELRVNTSDQRSAIERQLVILVDKDIPTTEIKCKINCLPFVVTTERLALEGYCQNCGNGSDVFFTWSLEMKEKGNWIPVDDADTFTTWTGSNIVIKPKVLKQNETYQLLLKAKRDKNAQQSTSVYIFKTSSVPRGGYCSISPGSGISADTKFQVVCRGWQATYYPLTYSIRYQSSFLQNVNVSSVVENNQIWILWYHGQEQSSPRSILPAGEESKDYYLVVNVRIQEKLGAFTTFNMSVKVGKAQNVSTESFKRALSKLNNVDVESHPQKFTQLVTTYSTILNEDDARKDNPQNKEIRFDLMQQLSKVKAVSLSLIKQTTDAVKLITYEATQVTHETQKVAADTLKKMSGTLVQIATDPTRRNGQVIDETARNLFSGLSKLLDASFFTGDEITKTDAPGKVKLNLYGTKSKKGAELEKIGKETGQVVSTVVSVIQDISLAILKKKLIGEQPTVTQTGNFDMKLDYTLTEDVDKVNKVSNATGHFRLPQDETLFSKGNYSRIYTEFVAFKNNPFSWDIDRSPFIQPRVLSLSFKTEQNTSVPIHNLTKNIEIFLLNEKQNINHFILEASKLDPDFLVHNFWVTQSVYMETLLLDIQLANGGSQWMPEARFFIRFGGQVSKSNFDFSHQFSDCTGCEGRSINIKGSTVLIHEFKKLKLSGGQVSIGVLPCPLSGICTWSFNSTVDRFMVYLTSVSCRFWDTSQWKTDGCSVGPSTTPWQTHCLCNHLTSFGSYIVKPNPLTKFSLDDFKQGYIIFVAVVTIFLLYLLVLVWARKADRANITKGRVCFLSDNNPEDRHRYEIAIWTGMRRNAGTQSKVTVILSGDLQDSEPRHLINPIIQRYQRGSLEKFLVTTPEDLGSLYCIRIWHDNSKGSWYLSRVMVTDLESDERFYFICDRWLAVDEDDGAIERLLPVSSDEELTEFQRLFFSRTKQNLSDSHLWISVLNRPPQSPFTRVQRLSCCLCLLMITMVTNAMFYTAKSEPKPNSTNFIGSYSFTWDEVFIGVVSSLIIFPANILILYIFRHVRPKPSKTHHSSSFALGRLSPGYRDICMSVTSSVITTETTVWGPGEDKQLNSVPDPIMKKKKKKKKKVDEVTFWSKFKKFLPRLPSSLPHCFVYFAWIILVVLTLGSATVLILYGMEFGNGRSLQWLFSILVSICEDIFVLQPLKVLIVALVFALLVKKPDDGEFKISAADDNSSYDDHEVLLTSPYRGDSEEKPGEKSPRLVVRPDEGQLKMMRKARVKDRKMFGLIQEIIVHLLFSIVISLVTYGHKDSRAIYLFRQLDELSANTEKIRNFSVFWNWTKTVLIPKAFPEKLYNKEDMPSYGFFDDQYNILISRARFRLLRVKQDSCSIPDKFKKTIHFCAKDYSIFDQDEASYGEGWTESEEDATSPWSFQTWRNLDGYPYWGRFKTYSGGGYVTELIPGVNNNETANKMEKSRWVERYSRALFVEFTIYNANVNLFSSILLLFEFPSFGGVFFRRDIRPMRLKVYVGGFAFFIFACEVVFFMFIAGYLYSALKKIYRNGVGYFKQFWNLIDFAIVSVSLAAIGVYIYRIHMITNLMQRVRGLDGKFVNFQYATYWSEVFDCVVATVVCLTTIKLTKLMRFNMRISLFALTLKRARPALLAFSLQFGLVFFAYVIVGVLVFGHNAAQFKSISSTILSLGCQILGKNQFTELSEIDPIVGPAFFVTFVLFVCWILASMFIAIVIDSYHQVLLDAEDMTNDYEIMQFFLVRFRAWAGLGSVNKTRVTPTARWQRAGTKVKAANTFGRHRRVYKPSAENVALEKTADLMERLETSIATLENRIDVLESLDGVRHKRMSRVSWAM